MAKQPIIKFKNLEEYQKIAKEWQDKLFLGDWLIKFRLVNENIIGKTNSGAEELGLCYYDSLNKHAVITVANGDGIIAEFTLIHELLHCLLEYYDTDRLGDDERLDDLELFYSQSIHTRLNQMAKSLLMAKYPSIDKDFFRIELNEFEKNIENKVKEDNTNG